jgi:hypothetical protein
LRGAYGRTQVAILHIDLVQFYSFKTGKTNQVGTVEETLSVDYPGISVSPDGRWLLYSYIADISSDLMMVDHFR